MIGTRALVVSAVLLASFGVSKAATEQPNLQAGLSTFQIADARDVVHDDLSGTIVRASNGTCVRTQWMTNTDQCDTQVAMPPRPMHQVAALSREERTVYFGFNQASLSPEMKQRLDTLASALRSDAQVKGARIVGYADRIGNPGYNEKLSKKRAEVVRKYVVSKGYVNMQVADTRWVGSSESQGDCQENMKRSDLIECLQKDRRVEVEIDYTPDVHAER